MSEFQLLRPWWLLGLLPLALLAWTWLRQRSASGGWHQLLPAHLQPVLLPKAAAQRQVWPLYCALLALLCINLALAGPTWQRLPQPVYQLNAGSVVVVDMSLSMYSTDLPPNRLTQLRFKVTDLVRERLDGEVGLVAYAGDAFTISPLTNDGANLVNLIRALSPDIMPELGSNPLAGLRQADELLRAAGYPQGDIYWVTDGIQTADQQDIYNFISSSGHRLSILAVATEAGAPIQLPSGQLYRDSSGSVVVPTVQFSRLESLAKRAGGRFSIIRSDQQDLDYLGSQPPLSRDGELTEGQAGDQWQEAGPWLLVVAALLLLPLARAGALTQVLQALPGKNLSSSWLALVSQTLMLAGSLVLLSGLISSPALAQTPSGQNSSNQSSSNQSSSNQNSAVPAASTQQWLQQWQQLWQTPYQQADQALQQQDYEQAAATATDPWQRGTANYRAGNYDQALVDFSQVDSAEGFYNQGNSLMQLGRYQEAANSYAAALTRRPDWPEAQENKALAEALQQQQEQQQDNQSSDNNTGQQQQKDGEGSSSDTDAEGQQAEQNDSTDAEDQAPADADEQAQEEDAAMPEQTEPQAEQEGEEQSQALSAAEQQQNVSDEQRQQMEQWLNRIEDDPAVLLRNKMLREAQQRRGNRKPKGVQQEW
ncbi:MAG: VWA domain-containing protein [Pseudidiomarina maritima]|nr:VWA domain-containing protein [Pseudidiomarina maritima]